MSLETSAWVASRKNAPKAPTQTSLVAFHAGSVLLGASVTHQETHWKVSVKHVSQEDMLQVLDKLLAMSVKARKHPRLVPLCASSAQAEGFSRITYVMTVAMELLQLAVPQAVVRVSRENTVSPTAPNANYAPPESSATKPKPPLAKPAYLVPKAPIQAPKATPMKTCATPAPLAASAKPLD